MLTFHKIFILIITSSLFLPISSFAFTNVDPEYENNVWVSESTINPVVEIGGYGITVTNYNNSSIKNLKVTLVDVNDVFNFTTEGKLATTLGHLEKTNMKYYLHPKELGEAKLYTITEWEDEEGNKYSKEGSEQKLAIASLPLVEQNIVGLTPNQTIFIGLGVIIVGVALALYIRDQKAKEKAKQ